MGTDEVFKDKLNLQTDYELTKRKWKLNIGRVSFVNHNDTKMSVFLAFAVTDRRPPSKSAQQFYTMCGGNAATMSELNTTVKYTPCIRYVSSVLPCVGIKCI